MNLGNRIRGRTPYHPAFDFGKSKFVRELQEVAETAAQVEQNRVETVAAGNRNRAQNRFWILLVADSTRKEDDKFVEREVETLAQLRPLGRRDRAEDVGIDSIVEPDADPRTIFACDPGKVAAHRHALRRELSIQRHQSPRSRTAPKVTREAKSDRVRADIGNIPAERRTCRLLPGFFESCRRCWR